MVTWDTGKRCNYDCTYCELIHHNNNSKFVSLEELKQTFEFVKEWTGLYRSGPTNINFTGGEPTANPNFWELVDYIKADDRKFNLSLTTNGSWGPAYSQKIIDRFHGATISYHTEADDNLKKRSLENVFRLHEAGMWLQVNVMMHMDHWDEAVSVCEQLKAAGIKHNPRPIGDGNQHRAGWFIDADGSNRRTSHTYTQEQQEWFWNYMGVEKKASTESQGTDLGRACCGGRCLQGKVNGEWQSIKLVNTEFKGWYCAVDQYFLHVDQDLGTVYHHQTCQALHNGQRGPIGKLADAEQLIKELKERLKNPSPIVCPNQRCGCGMCVPKAESYKDFLSVTTPGTLP